MSQSATANGPARPSLAARIGRTLLNFWGIALILVLWEALVVLNDFNVIVMPRPWAVFADIWANPGLYLQNFMQTAWVAMGGLVLGMIAGTTIAVLAWSSRILNGLLTPIGLIFSSIPVVAMIPVLARMLGYGTETVLAIVAILSFFPFFVFTGSGLKLLPAGSADLFSVFGAKKHQRLFHLALPSALPNWTVALRLASANAILGAMVAEFLMGTSGLGQMLHAASQAFNTERALGASVCATIGSVTLFVLVVSLEARVRERWT
jgi:ABC-type nitrate/sulfonate/bicarbonate transport system permease component|tara:strand:+ start:914 stop:1705 length:792 start_codon:yes stop_codon:yes gene_type:complete